MNLNKLFNAFDLNLDLEEKNKSTSARRGFLKDAGSFGLKTALAAIPLATLMMPRVAKADTSSVTDTLNFALKLEYLEDEFYKMALDASGLIPSSDRTIFMQISKHETEHVMFLKSALGAAAIPRPVFDFTAMGWFPGVFSDYNTFLALSQAFEDTGVRAYKGQAGNLISNDAVLTAALQIHSVEARHASEVRRLRGQQGWITGSEANGLPEAIYAGEDNITHGGLSLNSIASLENISMDSKTEAFDEPLSKEQILAIVKPFILRNS